MWWDVDSGGYGHMSGWGMGWAGGLLMLVVTVTVVAVAVAAVVALIRTSGPSEPPREQPRSEAVSTLDERFARGEIDEQEYLHRRSLLTR